LIDINLSKLINLGKIDQIVANPLKSISNEEKQTYEEKPRKSKNKLFHYIQLIQVIP